MGLVFIKASNYDGKMENICIFLSWPASQTNLSRCFCFCIVGGNKNLWSKTDRFCVIQTIYKDFFTKFSIETYDQ